MFISIYSYRIRRLEDIESLEKPYNYNTINAIFLNQLSYHAEDELCQRRTKDRI